MGNEYQELFLQVNVLSNAELALLYKKLWFDVNVRELYNIFGNDCSEIFMLVEDIICFRFCQLMGLDISVNCIGDTLNYTWAGDLSE